MGQTLPGLLAQPSSDALCLGTTRVQHTCATCKAHGPPVHVPARITASCAMQAASTQTQATQAVPAPPASAVMPLPRRQAGSGQTAFNPDVAPVSHHAADQHSRQEPAAPKGAASQHACPSDSRAVLQQHGTAAPGLPGDPGLQCSQAPQHFASLQSSQQAGAGASAAEMPAPAPWTSLPGVAPFRAAAHAGAPPHGAPHCSPERAGASSALTAMRSCPQTPVATQAAASSVHASPAHGAAGTQTPSPGAKRSRDGATEHECSQLSPHRRSGAGDAAGAVLQGMHSGHAQGAHGFETSGAPASQHWRGQAQSMAASAAQTSPNAAASCGHSVAHGGQSQRAASCALPSPGAGALQALSLCSVSGEAALPAVQQWQQAVHHGEDSCAWPAPAPAQRPARVAQMPNSAPYSAQQTMQSQHCWHHSQYPHAAGQHQPQQARLCDQQQQGAQHQQCPNQHQNSEQQAPQQHDQQQQQHQHQHQPHQHQYQYRWQLAPVWPPQQPYWSPQHGRQQGHQIAQQPWHLQHAHGQRQHQQQHQHQHANYQPPAWPENSNHIGQGRTQ